MALGAQLASPAGDICLFSDKTSFLYSVRELETAKRYKLPVIAIVFNDSFTKDKEETGVDCAHIARGFQCFGEQIKDPAALKAAYVRAKDSGLPAVLEVLVPPDMISKQSSL